MYILCKALRRSCLFFFDIQILIAPLVSSNSSSKISDVIHGPVVCLICKPLRETTVQTRGVKLVKMFIEQHTFFNFYLILSKYLFKLFTMDAITGTGTAYPSETREFPHGTLCGFRLVQSLVFCVMICRPLVVIFVLFPLDLILIFIY